MAEEFVDMPAGDMDLPGEEMFESGAEEMEAMPGREMDMHGAEAVGSMPGEEMTGPAMVGADEAFREESITLAAGEMNVMPGEQMAVSGTGGMNFMPGEQVTSQEAARTIELPGTWKLLLSQTSTKGSGCY